MQDFFQETIFTRFTAGPFHSYEIPKIWKALTMERVAEPAPAFACNQKSETCLKLPPKSSQNLPQQCLIRLQLLILGAQAEDNFKNKPPQLLSQHFECGL